MKDNTGDNDIFWEWPNKSFAEMPPWPGHTRHQYFLAIDGPTYDNWTKEEKSDWLTTYFGSYLNLMLTEVVLDTKEWVVYRLWLDEKDETVTENGPTE